MRLSSVRAPALAALLLLALALPLVGSPCQRRAASASTRCPASFRVLHNDRIGPAACRAARTSCASRA